MAAEADESRPAVKALSLFAVLVLARFFTLTGHDIRLSIWTPIAYFWQDILTALIFAVFDRVVTAIGREWLAWSLYGLMALYVAVNVAMARVLFSPLTWTMIHAAGGPLADSIRHHFTAANIGAIGVLLAAASLFPVLCSRLKVRIGIPWMVAALAMAALGPYSISKVETAGRYRNAFGALWPMPVPRAAGGDGTTHGWRESPFGAVSMDDLARYRGAAAGRNVVLVSLESAGARYLRPFGAAIDPMPNLTRMAARGMVFQNAYSVYPESIKGFFSVLCSRYPAFNVNAEIYAHVTCPALSQRLAAAGYRTGLFHSGRFMYLGMEAVVKNRGFDVLEDAGDIGGNVNSSFGVDEAAAVQRILAWIDSIPQGQRFFLTYLPIAGHHPYATPEPGPFPVRRDSDRYLNALHYGDQSLGDLFSGLEQRGLAGNTLFVVYGDHGEAFEQHDGNTGHTLFIYDENVHVPYVIAAPGLMPAPVAIRRTASLIDTAPTILDLLGLPIPLEVQGASLLDPQARMAFFFTDYSLGLLGLVDACWKYIYETNSGRSKLYELCRDPDETTNVSDLHPDRTELYRERVTQWIAAQKQ